MTTTDLDNALFLKPEWPAPANIKAFTTLKKGWGGRKINHDAPQEYPPLETLLQLPAQPTWLNQTHSTLVLEANLINLDKTGDASFSHTPSQVCAILTADCLPILLCNQSGTSVAAIHAGWRGLAHGIIENTVADLKQPGETLLAWLGPAIGPQKFEVGSDVYEAFTAEDPIAAEAFKSQANNKWLADLYHLARIRLNRLGITQIYGGTFCTYSQEPLFFSYRRDQGKTGRMVSLIWIADPV